MPLEKVRILFAFLSPSYFLFDISSSDRYALQLCTVVLEQSLVLAEISRKLTLEAKEWIASSIIKKVVLARVATVSSVLFPMLVYVIGILTSFGFKFRKISLRIRTP
jgi:hypothetical protein